jgi:hypothetical protein
MDARSTTTTLVQIPSFLAFLRQTNLRRPDHLFHRREVLLKILAPVVPIGHQRDPKPDMAPEDAVLGVVCLALQSKA